MTLQYVKIRRAETKAFTFLLGCILRCAAAALVCIFPALAPGFQTGLHQFHEVLRRHPLHLNMNPITYNIFCCTLLTVDIVLQCADALFIQAHHGWEAGGFSPRIHLHLSVQTLTAEDCRLLRDVTEVRLLLNFQTKEQESRTKNKNQCEHAALCVTHVPFFSEHIAPSGLN